MSPKNRAPRRVRAGIASVVLRVLPRESPLHRTWAGSKLLALTVLTVTAVVFPTWASLGILGVVTAVGFLVSGAAPSAVPRLPRAVWFVLAAAAVLAGVGGGLYAFAISTALTAVLTLLAAIAAWTTPLSDLAPALAVLWSPLRRIGVPVNEWSLTAALAVRTIPILFDEVRVLIAARRLRGGSPVSGARAAWGTLADILTSVLATAQRRANDFGRSMTLRGGVPHVSLARPTLTRADAVVLWVAFGGSSAMCILGVLSS
jgi:energy-coupling factor transport system permease protein